METLKEEEESTITVNRFSNEIIDDILSRLPVKSILRSRSVSKPWLSRISDPSFTKLHLARANDALFLSAYDTLTRKRHFLSAAPDGGPVTHLITFEDCYDTDISTAEHSNGLVCFTCSQLFSFDNNIVHVFVVNPSTRQMFKLPHPPIPSNSGYMHICCAFGFDESSNQHKILLITKVLTSHTTEFMIYSLSNHSWRKIDVEPPADLSCGLESGVCVNSVVHVMLQDLSNDILAFDLKTEKLSRISFPQGVVSHELITVYSSNGEGFMKQNSPFIMKINGCLGVVCHELVVESDEIDIWILQDYDNRVWVRETVSFPESWNEFGIPFPAPVDVRMDEIIFSSREVSGNVIGLHVYNMKTRRFKLLQFTLDDQFLCSKTVSFNHIKCYVESITPL
ncbi:hypothetical protein SSX86_008454 [Deinandra increscens subsp. villosa]|uniref:F-box domain-containing protein n=1 Tax=Deinandra increscens subsp. villosa TaxID=3103831 RepID=A0AAP0DFY1_9ASTR